MAQNLVIANATYSNVPAVDISKVGGGTARFVDTSGDSVTAAHLESGYTAHGADGEPILGALNPSGITPSGNIELTQQSGTDVTNYATASVRSASTTVSAAKSVSNHTATVTPSVAVGTSGWIASGKSGTPVTVSPTDLGAVVPSGTLPITSNGTYDVTNFASANVQTKAYLSDNLHNFATDVDDIYINTDGTVVPYAGWQATDFIPVDNTSFYFLNKTNVWYGFYDANKNFVSFAVGAITQFSNTNIKYFRASFNDADMANFNMRKLIVGEIQPSTLTQSKTVTANGDVYPDNGYLLSKVTVKIPYYEGW